MNKDKLLKIVKSTVSLASEKNVGVYAGNATLFLITAMFPLIMLIVSIINLLPGYSPDSVMDQIFSCAYWWMALHSPSLGWHWSLFKIWHQGAPQLSSQGPLLLSQLLCH